MSAAVALAWLVLANVIGALPSKRSHWPQAYALIAVGLPILIWVALTSPWWMTLAVLAGAASVLRWPIRYAARWVRARVPGQ